MVPDVGVNCPAVDRDPITIIVLCSNIIGVRGHLGSLVGDPPMRNPYWPGLWAQDRENRYVGITGTFALCAYVLALTLLITWQLHEICEVMG